MATNDELLRQWAQENGADYNLLAGAQNGSTTAPTTTTTGSSNNNDLYSEYGWDSGTLPGTNIPTTTTQTPTTTPATTTTGTPTTSGGTSVQDYINYYTSRGMTTPDMDYNTWANWMQGGGSSTTPTNPGTTTGTIPGSTDTPATPGTTTPTTGTTTGGTTGTADAMTEWNQIMARVQAGTATPEDYYRAQELANILSGGSSTTGTGTGNGNSQAQAIVDNSYNEFMRKLQQISANTGIPMSDLINMAANTPGYGTWQNGQLVIRDPSTGKYYYSGGATGGNTTPGTGITSGAGQTGGGASGQIPGIDNRDAISAMYDAQIAAQRAALQESGDQALSDAQANRDKIADLYNTQRNAASVDWERQRRNFLEGAATSGINTGSRSQAELSMMGMYQRRQNTLGAAQAQAEAEADRNIADIRRNTQASINEAIAKNDYQKAAALLDEYNEQYNRAVDRAEALAKFGDFTGYAALYGDNLATQMFYNWAAQNPATAYKMGAISDQQYNNLMMGLPINSEGAYNSFAASGISGGSGSNWASNLNSELEAMVSSGRMSADEARQIANMYGL